MRKNRFDEKNKVEFIKTTVISGIFFLIPIGVVIIIIDKLLEVMRKVATKLAPDLLSASPSEIAFLNLLALLGLLVICFLVGLIAQGPITRNILVSIESTLLAVLPGYSFVKGLANNLQRSDEYAESFIPVIVQFDDYSQIAFEIEREPGGKVALYLPGAPNPWSGTVVYVAPERVRLAPLSLKETLRNIRMLGTGSVDAVIRQRS